VPFDCGGQASGGLDVGQAHYTDKVGDIRGYLRHEWVSL
jgi:hypothetical protein